MNREGKHMAAYTLCEVMDREHLRVGRLSEIAGVSREYIIYLREFATDFDQISYICSVARSYNHRDYLSQIRVDIDEDMYNSLRSLEGSISSNGRKAIEYWRKKNGYFD